MLCLKIYKDSLFQFPTIQADEYPNDPYFADEKNGGLRSLHSELYCELDFEEWLGFNHAKGKLRSFQGGRRKGMQSVCGVPLGKPGVPADFQSPIHQQCSVLTRALLLHKCGGPALSPTVRTSSGPLAIQVDPQIQIARKINENWQLYLIMQPSAMCLQQTFFLRRVIILGVPI